MAEDRAIAEQSFARWPEDSIFAGTQDPRALEQRLYMQYLGAMTLLGSVVNRSKLSESDRFRVEQAFIDANVLLKRRGSAMYYEKCSGGGYAAFERSNIATK